MENLRSERILNGIENLESLNATLSQSLWSVNSQHRLRSIGSSNESLLSKRTSSSSLGEHPPLTVTTSADKATCSKGLQRLRGNFKSLGSVDFGTTWPLNKIGVSLDRTSSADNLPHRSCEMNGLSSNMQSALACSSLSEETKNSDLTIKSGPAHDKILPPELTSLRYFSDDSGTEGSDTNTDDSRMNGYAPRRRRLSDKGRGILSNFTKKLSDPGDFMLNGGDSSASRQHKYSSLSLPETPIISISSRSSSPRFGDECTQESGYLPIAEKDATQTEKDVAAPKMDMLEVLDTSRATMTKRHSMGSLGEPQLQQFFPLSFNSTLPSQRRRSQLLASHNSSSLTTLHKSRSRSESCLLSTSHGSYFDVVYVKDPHPPNYTKPNVATVKEEEEALTNSDHFKLKEEDNSTAKHQLNDEIASPPKSATKSKVMFAELTEVHSFIQESAESEVDSKPSLPNKWQLDQAWRPITSTKPLSESPTESFQVDTSLPGEPKVDTSDADEKLQPDPSIHMEGRKESIIELQDIEIQLVNITFAKPPERSKSSSTITHSESLPGPNPPAKPPKRSKSMKSLNTITDTHSDSLPGSNPPAKPPVSKPPASKPLAMSTEQPGSRVHCASTRTAGPLATLPPVRRASRFTYQRPKRESKLKQQQVNPSKSVRELSRMFEGPTKSPDTEPVPPPQLSPTASATGNKVANGKSTTTKPSSESSSPPADLAGKRASPAMKRKDPVPSSKIPTPINSPRMIKPKSLTSPPSPAHDKKQSPFLPNPETKSAATESGKSPRKQRSKRSHTTKPKPARGDVPARTRPCTTKQNGITASSGVKGNSNCCNNLDHLDLSSTEYLPGSRADAVTPQSSHIAQGEDAQSIVSGSHISQHSVPEARTIFRPKRQYSDSKFDECTTTLRRKILKQCYSVTDINTALQSSPSSTMSHMPHSHSQTGFRSTHEWMNFGASLPLKGTSKNFDKKHLQQERHTNY